MAECGRYVTASIMRKLQVRLSAHIRAVPTSRTGNLLRQPRAYCMHIAGAECIDWASLGTLSIIRTPIRSPWAATCQRSTSRCLSNSVPAHAIVEVLGSDCFSGALAPTVNGKSGEKNSSRGVSFRHLIEYRARQHRLAILDQTDQYLSPCAHPSPPSAHLRFD
jgi:hypothetical protein